MLVFAVLVALNRGMKAIVLCLPVFCLFSLVTVSAGEPDEFCIVQDSDGYTNVREKPDLKSKVIAKVDHGQIVWIYAGAVKKWPNVIFMDREGKERAGFIHASRVKPLTDFESITGKVSEEDQAEVFEKGELNVRIEIEPFDLEGRELTYKEVSEDERYLIEIDGSEYWGTDGGMPREQYKKIVIQQGEKTIVLPGEALKNLFNPGLYPGNTRVVLNPADDAIYITSFNSDGAGGYTVAFVIQKGKYRSRAVLSPF